MGHRVAIVGGFDVSNFGDLLFPLLAAAELRQRLDDVQVDAYAYRAMSTRTWPYEVQPVQRVCADVARCDALVVGGGLIIRGDEHIAAGYVPTDARIHHPLGLWLIPSLTAKLTGVPVAWNAPGVLDGLPREIAPLVALAGETIDYVAVRDTSSAQRLAALAPTAEIRIVPDTAFGVAS
jgi:lipopolysaccharide transport system ATP-binding protein